MIGTYFSNRFRVVLFACTVVWMLSWPSLGQSSSQQDGSQAKPAADAGTETGQTPMLRTNVDEVSLDIVVHDKGKRLILDLKPEELAITDNNTPVKLTGLRLVRGDSTRRHIVTMVFDPFVGATAKNARNAAEKILKVLPEGYSISVMDVRGRLRLVQNFTQDRRAVDTAINEETESNTQRLDSTLSKDLTIVTEHADAHRNQVVSDAEKNLLTIIHTGVDTAGAHLDVTQRSYAQSVLAALQESQKSLQDKHGYVNLGGLLALIHSQQKLGDRKALIYFTHNVVMDSAAKEMLKTISADSTRAGVTIYVVDLDALNQTGQYQLDNAMLNGRPPFNPAKVQIDPHGDMMTPMQQAGGGPIQGDLQADGSRSWGEKQDIQMMTDFTREGPVFSPFGDTKSPMAQLSRDTGGIYMDASGNLKKLLGQMVEDLGTYYEATYVPPIKEYDGSFRAIGVKPLRTGLRVQSKTGYYAVAPGADEGIRPFEVPLLKSLAQPTLPSDVKFRASVLRFGDLPDGNTNTFAIEVPISGLQTKQDAHTNLYSAQAAVYAEIKDASGTLVERFGDNLTRRGALESLDRAQEVPLIFARHFIAMPGKYTLNVAVADGMSGKMGAESVGFEIPDATNGLAMSDMVLVRKLNSIPEEEEDALNPLRYEHSRVTPDLSGQLAADAKGLSLFFMLHPDATSKEVPTLEMEVTRNGNPGRRIPLPLNLNAEQVAIPYLASFGSGTVAQGHYEVKAYLSQGSKTAVQTIAFNVGDGTAAASANVAGKSSDTGVTAIAAAPEVNVPGQLSITALKNPVPPLSPQDAHQLIEDARDRAVGYSESLPNFMVLEVISRSVDSSAMGNWKLKDTILELLRYRDKHETRTTLEVNGQANSTNQAAMKDSFSTGEFGGVLKSVFGPEHQAQFQWKETDELNGGTVQVFDYSVDQAHSKFAVVGTNDREIITGFHGQVYIDAATRSVRRVSLVADLPKDLAKDFSTRASTIRVDYDYVAINSHDYLLPVSAEMRLIKGRHYAALNTIEFRNYKRFGSNMRVLGFTPIDPQVKQN